MTNDTESKCPVMHGSLSSNGSTGTSNKDWWPNQLNLSILHQHDRRSDPMDEGFGHQSLLDLPVLPLLEREPCITGHLLSVSLVISNFP
jgi:hypothetical protein